MGDLFGGDDPPPAPDMSGVIAASKQAQELGFKLGQEQLAWAKEIYAANKGKTDAIVENILSDSQAARDMSQRFNDLSAKQEGLASEALDIKNKALGNADTQNAIQADQRAIQSKQLGVQDQQLANQADIRTQAQDQLTNQQGQLENQKTIMGQAQDQLGVQQKQLGIQDKQLGVQDTQLAEQQKQFGYQADQQGRANQLYNEYQSVYAPAKQQFMNDANAYDTAARRDQVRGAAQANVGEQFDAQRNAMTRQLEAWGVNPASTRFAALDIGTRAKEAAAKAAAGNTAALTNEERGLALRQAAIAQGQDLNNQGTAATGAAIGYGNTGATLGSVANAAGSNANAAGSNAIGAGNTAVGFTNAGNQAASNAVGFGNTAVGMENAANAAGNVGANYGQLANTAGSNAISAGNASTNALQAGTGAINSAGSAYGGATDAAKGELASSTAAGALGSQAGQTLNADFATGASAMGNPTSYLGMGNQATANWGNTLNTQYDNQLDAYKAEQASSSGIGSLLGAAAGIGLSTVPGGSLIGKVIGAAEGGAIPASTSPTGGQTVDDVPAQLTAGEFIIPRDVTSWYGEKFFQNLIAKAGNEKGKAKAKPAIGNAPVQPPAVVSRPDTPMGAI